MRTTPAIRQLNPFGAPPTATAWAWPGYALFFLMLFVPTAYRPLKIVLILAVLSIILFDVIRKGWRLPVHPSILFWTWLLTAAGVFFVGLGAVRGNPGALRVSTVHVVWPWLYLLFVAGVTHESIVRGLLRTLIVAQIAISLYSLLYILYEMGLWPSALYFQLDQGQEIGFYEGFVEVNLYSINSLFFLVPFSLACLLVWTRHPSRVVRSRKLDVSEQGDTVVGSDKAPFSGDLPVPRIWLWVAFMLSLVVVLLSGRRALILCVALAPVLTLGFRAFLPAAQRESLSGLAVRSVLGIAALVVAVYMLVNRIYGIDLEAMAIMFSAGFDFVYDASAGARATQFKALMEGWHQAPLLGQGLGAVASMIRSDEAPWAYELYYVSLLFSMGLVGVILYAAGIGWLYMRCLRIARSGTRLGPYIVSVLVGISSFLIASATNPYLGKYDYLWIIFLPIALVNFSDRSGPEPGSNSPAVSA